MLFVYFCVLALLITWTPPKAFQMAQKMKASDWLVSHVFDHMTTDHMQGANQSSVLGVTSLLSQM